MAEDDKIEISKDKFKLDDFVLVEFKEKDGLKIAVIIVKLDKPPQP